MWAFLMHTIQFKNIINIAYDIENKLLSAEYQTLQLKKTVLQRFAFMSKEFILK